MNRIDRKFQELRAQGAKAFMPYLCAGDPTPELTAKLLLTLEEAGADLIELGVPFSDPIADGPTVQRSSERALTHRISLQQNPGDGRDPPHTDRHPHCPHGLLQSDLSDEGGRILQSEHKTQGSTVLSSRIYHRSRRNHSLTSHRTITSPLSFLLPRPVHRNGCN